MISIVTAEWTDPRVAQLHAQLSGEMGGSLYRDRLAALSSEARSAAVGALTVDPESIEHTLLALDDDVAVATAALRRSVAGPDTEWEVKRVYVQPAFRGRGISRALMVDLEDHARSRSVVTMVLQTGDRQPAAVGLYRSFGYEPCELFPPYGFFPGEIAFRKVL